MRDNNGITIKYGDKVKADGEMWTFEKMRGIDLLIQRDGERVTKTRTLLRAKEIEVVVEEEQR